MNKAQSRNRQIAFAILAPARRKGKMMGMRTHRIPLLLRLFIASIIATLPAAIFAYPFGICVFAAAFFFGGGGPAGQASELSKMFADILLVPAVPFFLFFPNPGGTLNHTMLAMGFPYAWLFFTIILRWLGSKRWKRNIVKESAGQLPAQEMADSTDQADVPPTAK